MSAIYTASATATGREGRAVSSDGILDVPLAMPVQLGGSGAGTLRLASRRRKSRSGWSRRSGKCALRGQKVPPGTQGP